ncbi:hypothetical protein Emed_000893 [Eimeria media]
MGTLRLLVSAGAWLLPLTAGSSLVDDSAYEPVHHEPRRVDCRNAMNLIRAEVGLPPFTEPGDDWHKLPIVDQAAGTAPMRLSEDLEDTETDSEEGGEHDSEDGFLDAFCKAVLKEVPPQRQNQPKGTYMYAPQTSESEDCAGAAEYWRAAVSNFPSLPPAYTTDEALYKDVQNVSFVGLFNPRENPALDCAVITCRAKTNNSETAPPTDAESPQPPNGVDETETPDATPKPQPDGEGEGEVAAPESTRRRLSADDNGPVYSLICLSSPLALQESTAPFTISSSSSTNGSSSNSTTSSSSNSDTSNSSTDSSSISTSSSTSTSNSSNNSSSISTSSSSSTSTSSTNSSSYC